MKNILNLPIILTLVALLSFNAAFASEDFPYVVHGLEKSTKIYFAYNQKPEGSVGVRIFDEKGFVIYSAKMQDARKAVVFDLKEFGTGNYSVEITAGGVTERKEIVVGKGKKLGNAKMVLPKEVKKNQVEVVYLNNDSEVIISITDSKGNVVYSETSDLKNYRRLFNTSKLAKGTYTFRMEQGEQVITEVYTVE